MREGRVGRADGERRRDAITNDDVYAEDADVSLRPFTLLYNFSFVYIMDGEGKR